MTNHESDVQVVNPGKYIPICKIYDLISGHMKPICEYRPVFLDSLTDIEAKCSKEYMSKKTEESLTEIIEQLLGEDLEKYEDKIPLALEYLYNLE